MLYAMMSLAASRVIERRRETPVTMALVLYGAHLAANAALTPLFFRRKAYGAAELDAAAITVLVALTAAAFRRIDSKAALLLVPVFLWCGFATALTHAIRLRNE